jgi:Phospholipase B
MRSIFAALGSLALIALAAPRAGADFEPDPASVQRHGPAYRFPQAGWIVVHVEGQPYERGYQQGRLLAPEIAGYIRCFAAILAPTAPTEGWRNTRRLANALFVRHFEKEFLEELKGIADGATAAGARFDNRPIDLVDIVAINCWPEIEFLDAALEATPTGLEGVRFPHPQPRAKPAPQADHCSAFAATGPATADGKIVFGHITMFSLYAANFYNVWLDVKPAKGHRFVMCAYPGAIQSGMDYYINDAGLLIAETTIAQTRFHIHGQTEASRIRQAIQYAGTIDAAVEILKKNNNGLYTNEWLLGDINTNEIALFELGTHKSRLHRSSKKEWIGGTEGFYWGCNNMKDLELRLETVASVEGRPANVVFRPSDRDIAWQRLYQQHGGTSASISARSRLPPRRLPPTHHSMRSSPRRTWPGSSRATPSSAHRSAAPGNRRRTSAAVIPRSSRS